MDETITMPELLKREKARQEKAAKLLESPAIRRCTYSLGYINQPLYVCRTCTEKAESPEEMFAMCHGCSIFCHADHELIDIWDKRGFRCDCGNSKNKGVVCELEPNKEAVNEKNRYNHNFVGRYCWCDEPERENDEDDMFKCILCEDWFHKIHILMNTEIPEIFSDEDEYMCRDCVEKHPFLMKYDKEFGIASLSPNTENSTTEHKESGDNEPAQPLSNTKEQEEKSTETLNEKEQTNLTAHDGEKSKENEASTSNQGAPECKLDTLADYQPVRTKRGTILKNCAFWRKGWRKSICRCLKCVELFEKENISFLLDENDSPVEVGDSTLEDGLDDIEGELDAEEAATTSNVAESSHGDQVGIDPREMIDRALTELISAMPAERQRIVMGGVEEMRRFLYAKLEEVRQEDRPVSEEDIRQVFELLKSKKRKF